MVPDEPKPETACVGGNEKVVGADHCAPVPPICTHLGIVGRGVVGILEKLGIGLVPFSPLGEGFLTGRIDETTTFDSGDLGNAVPRFSPDNRRANQALVALLEAIAERKQARTNAPPVEARRNHARLVGRLRRRG